MRSKRFEKLTERPINRETFILIDHFIARHALNPDVAERAMNTPSREIARRLVDINVPRATILELASGFAPAKPVAFSD